MNFNSPLRWVLSRNLVLFSWYLQKGFTALHLAAKYGNIKVARLLLAKEALVDAQGKVMATKSEDEEEADE